MDLFDEKNIKPMLIGTTGKPFDSSDYIFELKLDGERCIAYLDENGAELRNKRNMRMLIKFPELSGIHEHVKAKCILDGELMVSKNGVPDFFEVQRRSLMSNRFKIDIAAKQYPASFVAFDILYYKGEPVNLRPLMERKALLESAMAEHPRLAVSRYIENDGNALYSLAEQKNLEGIVAKRKDSLYFFDKRTKDWIKIKNLQDDDFVVCGYVHKENNMVSIVLGQYDSAGRLLYRGHVTLGVSREDFEAIARSKRQDEAPFTVYPAGSVDTVWLEPQLVCTVKYMMKTSTGTMRQPVFKGLRQDKLPIDCTIS